MLGTPRAVQGVGGTAVPAAAGRALGTGPECGRSSRTSADHVTPRTRTGDMSDFSEFLEF